MANRKFSILCWFCAGYIFSSSSYHLSSTSSWILSACPLPFDSTSAIKCCFHLSTCYLQKTHNPWFFICSYFLKSYPALPFLYFVFLQRWEVLLPCPLCCKSNLLSQPSFNLKKEQFLEWELSWNWILCWDTDMVVTPPRLIIPQECCSLVAPHPTNFLWSLSHNSVGVPASSALLGPLLSQ